MGSELEVLEEAVSDCLAAPVLGLSSPDLVDRMCRLQVVAQRLLAAQLAVIREADGRGLAREHGAATMTSWLASLWRMQPATVARWVKLAGWFDTVMPAGREALASGAVNAEQLQVIGAAVEQLPGEHRAAGEEFLLDQARMFGPRNLSRLTDRILHVVAPDAGEEKERKAIERAETRAFAKRTLSIFPVAGTDGVRISGWLDRVDGAIVQTALDPLCAPRPMGKDHTIDVRTPAQRRADALVDVCRLAMACAELPDNGGDRPQIVVTIPLTVLRGQLGQSGLPGIAELDDGARVSAATARRIACDAGVVPAVLGGEGQVLDLGRQRRLFIGPIRRALVLRDKGCAFPACDRPARWCDGHHVRHWADGGASNLGNAVLLCGFHHRVIHHGDWQVRIHPGDGLPEFIPPVHLDALRRPQRNLFHRRQ